MTYFSELLAVFLLFKLLPVPVDFDILLVRLDHFILDLVSSFLLGFFFVTSASAIKLLRIGLDFDDAFLSLAADLLKNAYTIALVTFHRNSQQMVSTLRSTTSK